jgi:pyruvate formate lyase activating enzyme
MQGGKLYSVDEVLAEINKYRSYMRFSNGGITISGGEPLLQLDFVCALIKRCRAEGIHTAIDTSGGVPISRSAKALELTDMVLLDLKAMSDEVYREITGAPLEPVIDTADFLEKKNIRTWVRHVLVPGITDDENLLKSLAEFIAARKNIELVEILPFHQYGKFKWAELGYAYPLAETEEPSEENVSKAIKIFESYGIKTKS